MPIINEKKLPILPTKEQMRKQDFLKGMCQYVSGRCKAEKEATDQLFRNMSNENPRI
jgi:hypothetical protein